MHSGHALSRWFRSERRDRRARSSRASLAAGANRRTRDWCSGCQWKALPAERFGSASAIHRRFLEWEKAGVFLRLWQAGLAEYDEMEGIAWRWQSIDGALLKAPLAQESVGPNPTDRGKKWQQANAAGRRAWRPAVDHRDRGQPK
jgi:transposase